MTGVLDQLVVVPLYFRKSAMREYPSDLVMIWSNRRHALWGWDSKGYVTDCRDAGLYSREDAQSICDGTHGGEEIREVDWKQYGRPLTKKQKDKIKEIETDLRSFAENRVDVDYVDHCLKLLDMITQLSSFQQNDKFNRDTFIKHAKRAFSDGFKAVPVDVPDSPFPLIPGNIASAVVHTDGIQSIPQYQLVEMCKALGIQREEIFDNYPQVYKGNIEPPAELTQKLNRLEGGK